MKVPKPRKVSSGNWVVRVRVGGVDRMITCATEKECIRQAQLYKAEVLSGKREAAKEIKKPLTLRAAIDNYIAARSNVLSPATIRSYHSCQRTRFQSIMDTPLSQIRNWQSVVNNESALCSASTLSRAWGFVHTVLLEQDIRVPAITLPQDVPTEHAFLQPEQIRPFIEAVHGKSVEIPALLALSSFRRSEILGLDWKNVDLEHDVIHIAGALVDSDEGYVLKSTNKTVASRRDVPILIPELQDALEAVEVKEGLVVKLYPTTIYQGIERACKAAGLPFVGIHGLRHSFASLCYHLNLSEKIAMQLGGWSDISTMRNIYTHIAQTDMDQGLARLKAYLGSDS